MDKVIEGFLTRNIPAFKDSIDITITNNECDNYVVTASDGRVKIEANNYISAFHGLYEYLKKYCNVQLSWCGNRKIDIDKLVMFDGEMTKTINAKYRVYMNYCTLDYSMCWWDFSRWEKEIDFMAMNGINMPLAVVGSEAVWYETWREMGFTEEEALSTVSGPAFWAWHLMTNIESYLPPPSTNYIEERLELGKKILARYIEFGMQPIQQGFSGHVPMLLRKKFPKAKIIAKKGWCGFPKTAQLDPLDKLFEEVGLVYLNNMKKLFGNYHYIACDPFHEGVPPKPWKSYLTKVGQAINSLYEKFDKDSVWVMQGWTPREQIIKAVPKNRLLILDLSSDRTAKFDNFWGYNVVAGMLHDFGGKNAMQGKIRRHTKNCYRRLKDGGANVVGTGMFMEGIEQNPVVYDLQFKMLTENDRIDYNEWLANYQLRRYGKSNADMTKAWNILMDTCYSDSGYEENEVGSTLAARPQPLPIRSGPCCYVKLWYDTKKLEEAIPYMINASCELATSDGFQYDICDTLRQVLSNRFHDRQVEFARAYKVHDVAKCEEIASSQIELMKDIDELISHRSEMCLSRWICDAKKLATSKEEEDYFELNARTLITLWGDINGDVHALYDYSWREWSGLINEYYVKRWEMFYHDSIKAMREGKKFKYALSDDYYVRKKYKSTPFNAKLYDFELNYVHSKKTYDYPVDTDVMPSVIKYAKKYNLI